MTIEIRGAGRATRFSLRTLLLAMTVVALWLGWTSSSTNRQRRAVQTILAAGGQVRYEHEAVNALGRQEPPVLRWFERWLGVDWFRDVIEVSLNGGKGTSASFAALAAFPRLEVFSAEGPQVADSDYEVLRALPRLKTLCLFDVKNKPAAFEPLAGLPNLEAMCLAGPGVTDETLRHVGRLSTLKHLEVWGRQIGSAGVIHLANCRALEQLQLLDTGVSDEAAGAIAQMANLEYLSLRGAAISDSGLAALHALPKLKRVNLKGTNVSDAGAAAFEGEQASVKVLR